MFVTKCLLTNYIVIYVEFSKNLFDLKSINDNSWKKVIFICSFLPIYIISLPVLLICLKYIYIYKSISIPVCLSVCQSVSLPACLPAYLPACLPACLRTYLPTYLPMCVCIYIIITFD